MDAFVSKFPEVVAGGTQFRAGHLDLPPGSYVVFAKAELECLDPSATSLGLGIECTLKGGGSQDQSVRYYSGDDCKPTNRVMIALTIGAQVLAMALTPADIPYIGPIELLCLASTSETIRISNVTITAIGVERLNPT